MKKVLIISYFFPPANFAGSYRIGSWAKHLHKSGYYPIIVTRAWNANQTLTTDVLENNTFQHEKYDTHEVYRLPYHGNLRDRIHARYGESGFVLLRKFLTLMELIFQNFSNSAIPYHNLYYFSRDLIGKEKDIKCVILSGRPFQLFKFGDMLHRATGIKWIADYRDEWNTHQWSLDESLTQRTIRAIESSAERKWLKTAALFTTCSDNWVEHISAYIGRPGRVVLNGYEDDLPTAPQDKKESDTLTIVHNGTLYSAQPIEIFLDGYKKFIDDTPGVKVKLLFPGVENIPEQGNRIRIAMKGYEQYLQTSSRIPKSELIEIMASADLFLMVGTQGVKGHHSSKIFEYLGMQRPIILCPDDEDVMGELMRETKAGFSLKTSGEVKQVLSKAWADLQSGHPIDYAPDVEKVAFYSRGKQANILSQILDEVEAQPVKETTHSTFTHTLTDKQTADIIPLYRACAPVYIEQYPGFAQANTDNNIIHYIQSDANGKVIAYAQIDMRHYRIAGISFGPIAASGEAYKNALTDIKNYCTKNLTPILRITPPYFISQYGIAYYEELRQAIGFETSDKEINWSTLVLSTTPSEEDILKGFADNHRQSVKKAVKMGLQAELVTDASMIDTFSEQHSEMYRSRGLSVDREKNKIHFRKLFDFFEKNDLGYFVIVKEAGKVIGGVCCVIQGNAVRYLEGYSHPGYRKYPISHIALYEAIKIAKRRGIPFFDFGGYANNVKEGDQLYGINKFKEAFRGEPVNYPKTMLIFTLPFAKWLYHMRKG